MRGHCRVSVGVSGVFATDAAPCRQACAGYTDLTGVDYAGDAVRLARMVADDRKVAVTFEVRCSDKRRVTT